MARNARRLTAAEDFGALAKELSDDAESAAREGRLSVFERGPRDVLLKAAAFELELGKWAGPIESPVGSHFLLREDPAGYDAALWESNFARLRTILIRHKLTEGSTGALVPADYERTVEILLSGGSDPVISKEPTGAWTHKVTDKAGLGS